MTRLLHIALVTFMFATTYPPTSRATSPTNPLVSQATSDTTFSLPVQFSMAAPSSVDHLLSNKTKDQAIPRDTSTLDSETDWQVSAPHDSRAESSRAFKKSRRRDTPYSRNHNRLTTYKTLPDEVLLPDQASRVEIVQALEYEANEYSPSAKYPQSIGLYSHNYNHKERPSSYQPQSDYLASASDAQPTLYDSLKMQQNHVDIHSNTNQNQFAQNYGELSPQQAQFMSHQPHDGNGLEKYPTSAQHPQNQNTHDHHQEFQNQNQFTSVQQQHNQNQYHIPPNQHQEFQNQNQLATNQDQEHPNQNQYPSDQHSVYNPNQTPSNQQPYHLTQNLFTPIQQQYPQTSNQFQTNQQHNAQSQMHYPQNAVHKPFASPSYYESFPPLGNQKEPMHYATQPAHPSNHIPPYTTQYQNSPLSPQYQMPNHQPEYMQNHPQHEPHPPHNHPHSRPPSPNSHHSPYPEHPPSHTHHGPLSRPPYPHHSPPHNTPYHDPDPELTQELKELQQLDKEYHDGQRLGSKNNMLRLLVPLLMLGLSIPALGYMYTLMNRRRGLRSDNTGYRIQKEHVEHWVNMFQSAMQCYAHSDQCIEDS